MKLTEIKIRGYKSIEKLDLPVRKYGDSYATIFIGKNETGKSNVLDALATPQHKEKVVFSKIANQQKEPETVSVFFGFAVDDADNYRDAIAQVIRIRIPQALLDNLKITKLYKEMFLQESNDEYGVDCNYEADKLDLRKFSFITIEEPATPAVPAAPATPTTPATPEIPAKQAIKTTTIKANVELATEDEKNAYTQLNAESFKEIINDALWDYVYGLDIPIDIWKYEDQYLINDKIPLKTFAGNPSTNMPLKNLFYLAGYTDQQSIKDKVDEIEKDNNKRKRLEKKLSTEGTKYLNEKWQEHEINIEVEIESSTLELSVAVKDNADENSYFDMSDRSQGFKQFISLLLSISISSMSGDTSDHLILIDEPEVHLHPSGVRWMLKELLKIGESNYLFISTHSNFMLDKGVKERHYLLTKGKDGLTEAHHITDEEDINDDEVLQSAFGINVITDFLTPHTLLVEGATDKKLLQKALKQVKSDNDVLITNGTGANIVAVASYLLLNNVVPMVVVDDDTAGKEAEKKILKIGDGFTSKTYTIRDLNGAITTDGTIEDTLPKDFVEAKVREVLSTNGLDDSITLHDTRPFCSQIVDHYGTVTSPDTTTSQKDKKVRLNTILTDIKIKIAEYDQKSVTQAKTPKLYKLAEEILAKFNNGV